MVSAAPVKTRPTPDHWLIDDDPCPATGGQAQLLSLKRPFKKHDAASDCPGQFSFWLLTIRLTFSVAETDLSLTFCALFKQPRFTNAGFEFTC